MQYIKQVILVTLCLISLQTLGQGVPKAYEGINYQGKINNRVVRLMLANGYIGASSLNISVQGKTKPVVFAPEADVADEHKRLKFVPASQSDPDYIILNNMQEAYEDAPDFISGTYFLNGQKIPVKLELVKARKH